MFNNEHNPPYFLAEYQGQKGIFDLEGNKIKGRFNAKNAQKLIKEWAQLHHDELVENWNNIEQRRSLNKIAPLD